MRGSAGMECRPEGRRKEALKQRQIWAIRFFLDREGRMRPGAVRSRKSAIEPGFAVAESGHAVRDQ